LSCVDERKFACDWPDCRKSYLHADNLASHTLHHTQSKPFNCDQCPLGYWQKSSLRSHRLKVHGPSLSTATSTVTDGNTSLLVDDIIKSVSASLQPATDGLDGVTQSVVEDLSVNESQRPEGKELTVRPEHKELTDPDVIAGETEVLSSSTATDVMEQAEVRSTSKQSDPPLNVYEFCEDETVNIRRPKLSNRGTAAESRASIELTQGTIESDTVNEEDEDDHDLLAFDDDTTPRVDRLAETVITYSRKKKTPTSVNDLQATGFTGALSPTKTKQFSKRRSSVAAGQRRKRIGRKEEQEVSEESRKKRVRRQRPANIDDDYVDRVIPAPEGHDLPSSRSSKRSRKNTMTVGCQDEDDGGKSLAESNTESQVPPAPTGKRRGRKARKVERSADMVETGGGDVVLESSEVDQLASVQLNTVNQVRSRKVRGQKPFSITRQSPRRTVNKDDVVDEAGTVEDVRDAGVDGESSAVLDVDVVAGQDDDDDGLSDNTEILSVTVNDNAAESDNDDDELTHRSSPASYRSDEHQPHAAISPGCHGDNDSSGECTPVLTFTVAVVQPVNSLMPIVAVWILHESILC